MVDRNDDIQNAIDIAYQAYDEIMSLNKGKDMNRFYAWVETSGTGPPSVWKTYVYLGKLISNKYLYFSQNLCKRFSFK